MLRNTNALVFVILMTVLFQSTAFCAIANRNGHAEFQKLWRLQDKKKTDVNIQAIPTGSDLIYTFSPTVTQSKNIRMNFYSDTGCATNTAFFIISNVSFTNGQVWYLSGEATRIYVNNRFVDGGSSGAMRIAQSFALRDTTSGTTGSCTQLVPLGAGDSASPFQSTGTPGSLSS